MRLETFLTDWLSVQNPSVLADLTMIPAVLESVVVINESTDACLVFFGRPVVE